MELHDIEAYFESLNNDYRTNVTTEHSFRGSLQQLLRQLLNSNVKKDKDKVVVINEPSRKEYGAPDFEFRRNDVSIAFMETKKINDTDLLGENSKQHKEQFDRYKKAVNMIAFTDYLRFHLFENGEKTLSATIGKIENGEIVINNDEQQLSNFIKIVAKLGAAKPQPIRSARLLAETMAAKAKIIADVLNKAMVRNESSEDQELHLKLDAFKKFLVHDMSVEQFTDFYAQTIVYGLFVARIYDKTPKTFSLQEAAELIPASNPFLKKIFKHLALADLHSGVKWIVEDLVSIFRVTEMKRVMRNYGKDPLVHFYEEFLESYNPKIREDFGVWYTPHEIVGFIVDSVDAILREKLNIDKGLADNSMITHKDKSFHKVQILDPATGTGTFLAVAAGKIYDSYKGQEGRWPEDVVKHIVPRLNGFEYLMAPYTMAHLKVATALHLDELLDRQPERLNIFLTNSLDEDYPEEKLDFAKFITDESNAASFIKRETPVMVVIGNPPYNEKSANNGEWIMGLMNDYKQEPGKQREYTGKKTRNREKKYVNTLQERNPKGLNNDYCKFIRLGQNFVENTQEGVLAYICGNTFLDTSLFRGMRYELLRKFDEIYIINLHGSTKRNESTDERKDECVFNILVGVSINIFIKYREEGKSNELAKVYYHDVYGTQKDKLQYLAHHRLCDIGFQEISPSAPLFTFRIRDFQLRDKYDAGFNIRELMKEDVKQGLKTGIDSLLIHRNRKDADLFAGKIKTITFGEMEEIFHFPHTDALKNKYLKLQNTINERCFNPQKAITEITYRPFDNRWTIYGKETMDRPRPEIEKNILNKKNIVLCLGKEGSTIGDNEWSLVYISTLPTDINVIPRGGVYLFPLFVYNSLGMAYINFSETIVSKIEEQTRLHLQRAEDEERKEGGFIAVDLLDYIYAILHSKRYRKTYHECLQDGFPTIPYPSTADYFFQMAEYGKNIRLLHLLIGISEKDFVTSYPVWLPKDNNLCEKRVFEETGDGVGKVWINEKQYFDQVPRDAWNLIVSGYQPLDRWLKDRKGKKLTNDEIDHYQKMIVALQKQIKVMEDIDILIDI